LDQGYFYNKLLGDKKISLNIIQKNSHNAKRTWAKRGGSILQKLGVDFQTNFLFCIGFKDSGFEIKAFLSH